MPMNPWDDPYNAQLDPALVNRLRPMRQQPQQAAPSPLDAGLMAQLGRGQQPLGGGIGVDEVLPPTPYGGPTMPRGGGPPLGGGSGNRPIDTVNMPSPWGGGGLPGPDRGFPGGGGGAPGYGATVGEGLRLGYEEHPYGGGVGGGPVGSMPIDTVMDPQPFGGPTAPQPGPPPEDDPNPSPWGRNRRGGGGF